MKNIRERFNLYFFRKALMVFIIFFFIIFNSNGQEITYKLDTNIVQIGDQVHLKLKVAHQKNVKIIWPAIPDSLGKVEVLKKSKLDTSATDANTIVESQSITLSAFDSGNYFIPSLKINYLKKEDTARYSLQTDSLLLRVNMIPVDTSKAIRDIKPPLDVPFTWVEALPYIGAGLAILCIAALIYYFIRKYRKGKVKEILVKPRRQAHESALEALQILEKEKLWQEGRLKEYHSRLSEIIRNYIEERFEVPALEQTTDEIMSSLETVLTADDKIKLKQLLELADLVKFAKAQPIGSQNDLSLSNAYAFVHQTKKTEAK